MQILVQRVWGEARESAFLTSSGLIRAAGPRTKLLQDPEALAPGQSAVRARDKSPCSAEEQNCRDMRAPARGRR